jgi:hypothetical protein
MRNNNRFPERCLDKDCDNFYIKKLDNGDLIYYCSILKVTAYICDEDFSRYICPKCKEISE